MPTRIAVLASGRGSNLRALFEHRAPVASDVNVALVASDRAGAGALALGRQYGAAAVVLEQGERYEDALSETLSRNTIDLVVLAGYLRLVPPSVVRTFRGRMLNVHPALLPAFGGRGMYGERVHRAVLEAGARVSGATVHFVDEVYDHGAIIAQWPVPVLADDTASVLARRVLRAEHALLPRAVHAVAHGAVTLDATNRARGTIALIPPDAIFSLATCEDESFLDAPQPTAR
ncbi:MAG: phosphoribosylglycinamide formyltransferase [Gemmatimonadaceae bacterium]